MEEYLRSAKPVLRVWFSPRLPATARKEVQELCRAAGIDCRHAPDAKLASLTGSTEHGGVVAQPSPTSMDSLDDLLLLPLSARRVVFALDGVENPRNLGLVARVLVAAGCATVLLPAKGGALPGQVFLEASAGYGTRLRIVRVPKLVPALERLKREGYVTSRPYRGVFLTEAGAALAERVRARHRLIVDTLCAIGVPAEAAEADAEGMEHHASEATLAAFARFLLRVSGT